MLEDKGNKSQAVVPSNLWFSGKGLGIFHLWLLIAAWKSTSEFIGFAAVLCCGLSSITIAAFSVVPDRTIYCLMAAESPTVSLWNLGNKIKDLGSE